MGPTGPGNMWMMPAAYSPASPDVGLGIDLVVTPSMWLVAYAAIAITTATALMFGTRPRGAEWLYCTLTGVLWPLLYGWMLWCLAVEDEP